MLVHGLEPDGVTGPRWTSYGERGLAMLIYITDRDYIISFKLSRIFSNLIL
jgi:hypothetical protein